MSCHFEKRGKYKLESPKSGWETLWQKLIDTGILTLPDSSELEYKNLVEDGKGYVVETNTIMYIELINTQILIRKS
jgi:hypothetical protein